MGKTIVATANAPAAIGPYSQAVRADGFVFTAGQVAIDPASAQLIEGDVVAQTRQVIENLRAVLEASGSSLEQVVKTTVFMVDLAEFGRMNEVYREYFPSEPPARSTVGVARLPLGAQVEIEAVARVRDLGASGASDQPGLAGTH